MKIDLSKIIVGRSIGNIGNERLLKLLFCLIKVSSMIVALSFL